MNPDAVPLVVALVGLLAAVLYRLRLRREQRADPGRWWSRDHDGNIEWHEFPKREARHFMACPTCGNVGPLDTDDRPCEDGWHLENGSQLEREVAAFIDAATRTNEALREPDPALVEQLASLTGTPEGVGPSVRPDCPICTGGRGLPCAWHALS